MKKILLETLAPLYFHEGEAEFNGLKIKSTNHEGDWLFLVEDYDEGYTPFYYYDDTDKKTVSLEDIAELIWNDILVEHFQVENPERKSWFEFREYSIYVSDGKRVKAFGNAGLFGYQTPEEAKEVFNRFTDVNKKLHSLTPYRVESSGKQFTFNPNTEYEAITITELENIGCCVERSVIYKLFCAE